MAVPVSPKSTANLIKAMVEDFVGIVIDDYDFSGAISTYYDEFNQVEDEKVIEILNSEHNLF